MLRISRPCYDKFHRCPGSNGGGFKSEKRRRCVDGYISYMKSDNVTVKPAWKWRLHRCNKCNVAVLPYVTRWLDPTWLVWAVPMCVKDWNYRRKCFRGGNR